MAQNNFIVDLIAKLHEARSRKQIQADAKRYADIKVPLTGTLDKAKTRAQIERDVASLNTTTTVNLKGKVDKKNITTSAQQVAQQAQNIANKQPIKYNVELRKDKLINDIKIFGQQNSKMFKDSAMSSKYYTLLDSAKLASSGKELTNLRAQLSALRSEIKANNLAGLTLGETFKRTFKRIAQFFTGTRLVMLGTQQLRQAWTEAMNLDKAYTGLIKVQDELTRSDYPAYLDECNKKAKELATTQQALIESTTEFSKSGYDLATSDALAEQATILANVGDMSATDSSKAIISGVQAFEEVDGYTDVLGKAEALIDKYNKIGNTASITSAEIAQGVQAVGSVFADSNTSVDEFIALLAAGNRQFQNSDTLALSLRTSALRIRSCTTELELMGEETDDVITSTATLEKRIRALTNIDGSGGVEILEADGETFRSIFDIYLDISKVYQQMSDKNKSALLQLIAGKNRASAVSATLNNMSEAQEIYQRSLSSAGSAQEEYNKYLQGSEASLNTFKASMTEAYQSVIDGSTTKAILDCGTATLDFANSLGIIESTLKGFLAIGIVKGVTKLSMAFKASSIQASNFGIALKTANNMNTLTKGTSEYVNAMNTLKVATSGLSEAKLRQVLASKSLNDSQRIEIMQTTGLSKAQARAKLSQLGLIQGAKSQATAQNIATASTFKLSSAVRGFASSCKAAFASNPITLSIMAISTVVGVVSSAVDSMEQEAEDFIQKQEEIISKSEETISSTQSEIESLEELREKLKDTNGEKEELLKLSSDIESVLGKESTELLDQSNAYDLLNAKIQDNINLRKQEQKEANKEKKTALRDTVENAVIENEGLGESVTFGELQSYGFQGGKSTQSIFNDLVKDARNDEDFTNSVEEYAELWRKAVEKAQANMPDAIELGLNGQYDIFGGSMPSEKEIKSVLNGQIENVLSYFEEEINSGKGFLSSERLKQAVKQMWLEGYDFGDISEGLDGLLSTNSSSVSIPCFGYAISA